VLELRFVFLALAFVASWIGCGCTLVVFGDNLDPAVPHRMGSGYAVVFTSLTAKREASVGLELFGLGDRGAAGARQLMLVARRGTEVVAGYARPGKYEIGGLQLETRGGRYRSVAFERHRRDEYAYFGVVVGACNWIGDYAIDTGAAHGASVSQLVGERDFTATSAAFRERFADLARRCSVRSAVIER
jgi:hypothetical protein